MNQPGLGERASFNANQQAQQSTIIAKLLSDNQHTINNTSNQSQNKKKTFKTFDSSVEGKSLLSSYSKSTNVGISTMGQS